MLWPLCTKWEVLSRPIGELFWATASSGRSKWPSIQQCINNAAALRVQKSLALDPIRGDSSHKRRLFKEPPQLIAHHFRNVNIQKKSNLCLYIYWSKSSSESTCSQSSLGPESKVISLDNPSLKPLVFVTLDRRVFLFLLLTVGSACRCPLRGGRRKRRARDRPTRQRTGQTPRPEPHP